MKLISLLCPDGDLLIWFPFLVFFFLLLLFHSFSAISLDIIRSRLDQGHSDRYRDVQSFIDDVRLMFNNVYLFYQVGFRTTIFEPIYTHYQKLRGLNLLFFFSFSILQENTKIYKSAKYLEKFLNEQLKKLLSDYLPKKSNETSRDRTSDAKRTRIDSDIPTEIIDDDD